MITVTPILLAMAAVGGRVDAVSFIALGHVFTTIMTGNIVFLGFAIGGVAGLSVWRSLLALAFFMSGAVLGGCMTRTMKPQDSGSTPVHALAVETNLRWRWIMLKNRKMVALIATILFLSLGAVGLMRTAHAQSGSVLRIDVPVKLEKANVVFDVGHNVLVGDMPFVLGDLQLFARDYADGSTQGQIVVVLHGDAAYLVLNDASYNTNRHVQTGNPFGSLVAGLMKQGVQVELCGATATANHWVNANLLPGVKVNTNAMVRVTQLEQTGYTLIYE